VAEPLPPAAPAIVAAPRSQLVQEGQDVTFSVSATGSPTLTYQWFFQGLDLLNETNRVLRLTGVSQLSQQGQYWVVVSNPEGSVESAAATLTINAPPLPGDDYIACGSNQPVTLPVTRLTFNDYEADGDALTVLSVSGGTINGGTTLLAGGMVTYTPPDGFVGTDQFAYTVQDARGGRGTGNVFVTVGATNFLSVVSAPVMASNGHFQVGYQGIPGYPYVVEWATSLEGPWEVLTTVIADANGYFQLDDPNEPPQAVRFYRVSYP
jgi:hypothetical protein